MATDTPIDVLIDTSLIIDHLRRKVRITALTRSLAVYGAGAISAITQLEYEVGELHVGRRPDLSSAFPSLVALPLNEMILRRAPHIQARSIALNKKMELADLLIAATAIAHNLPLLTLNYDHFSHVRDLRLLKVR